MRAWIRLLSLSLGLACAASALPTRSVAATDLLAKCRKDKLAATKVGSKDTFVCKSADLKGGVSLSTFDATCLTPPSSKLGASWDKAILSAAKKDVSCFNAPNAVGVADGMQVAAASVSAALRAGFAPGDDANPVAVTALNNLMKTAETYLAKTLSLESANAFKPDPTKLASGRAKAALGLTKKFRSEEAKALKKGVVFTADDASVLAAIDAWVGGLASDVQTNPIFPLGRFEDAAAQGVTFAPALDAAGGNATISGGWFPITGASMVFSIGGTPLGMASVSGVVTPVMLVPGATDETHPTVTNIVRLLLTLDDDGKPNNGIVISPAVDQAASSITLDLAQSISAFESDTAVLNAIAALTALTRAGARPLVSVQAAQSHASATLIAQLAGTYQGTYTGDDTGTWTLKISTSGVLSGSGQSSIENDRFSLRGSVASDGSAVFGTVSGGGGFSGAIVGTTLSGSWMDPGTGNSGTFTGSKL